MKTLKNAVTSLKKNDTEFVRYSDLVAAVANFMPPQSGLVSSEISKRLRLLDVADKGGEELSFEDSDAENLKELTAKMTWAVISRDIVDFSDAVAAM
ncbi:MAG: hypothetical protein M0R37_14630 [Bacteroidales bacterium]|jgi:hypothetical protein|nr:hypothetical protein [Sphaerochaeta sp.]MCK9629813.1 hypothetical protein [Bacteroidales bacterium]